MRCKHDIYGCMRGVREQGEGAGARRLTWTVAPSSSSFEAVRLVSGGGGEGEGEGERRGG